jgi:hypothetical protein
MVLALNQRHRATQRLSDAGPETAHMIADLSSGAADGWVCLPGSTEANSLA